MADDNNNPKHIPLEESIQSAHNLYLKVVATNALEEGLVECEPLVSKSLYHNFLKCVGLIIFAVSSMKKEDIDKAAEAVQSLGKYTNKFRKHGLLISALKMVKTPNYNKYTDLELHAELLHAYYVAMSALICGLETHTIVGLIKVAYRLQKFLKSFKGCRVILKKRKTWESETSRLHFEAGVRFANGLKNLTISQIPPKLLRVINFVGIKGQESVGMEDLNKAAFELPGINSRFARMFFIGYWLYGQPHGGLGPKNLTDCEAIIKKEMDEYPKSVIYRGCLAKLDQIRGDIDGSIAKNVELLNNDFEPIHKAVHFELMWSHALKAQWDEAIKYAELVRKNTEHSPTYTTYAEAVFRYVKCIEDNDVNQKQIVTKLMETIPTLRIRHLGKTITPEKVAVECSVKYMKNNEFLILPEMDLLYQGNWIQFIKGNEVLLNKLLVRVDKELKHFQNDIAGSDPLDNYLSAVFYKAVIMRLLGKHNEAKQLIQTIITNESRIIKEKSIAAQAVLELGLNELETGNTEESKKWINKCIDNYSGYLNENYVHLRAYSALREMGVSTDKQKEDEVKLEEYKKQWLKDINIEEKNYETIVGTEDEVIVN
ncbi:tetratricopeptide repeat protein 39A-like [Oppia nitens]|uniref:tetratricopeptide repeat protein 39A-like n=1 Tax=Oppia nitens TaxID=1686743 RepID=UPI0023DA3C0D|nr:tetratricopeptide repeat protein 39A-like [Oppia nitens]